MVSPTTSRREGLTGGTAFKAPVTVIATGNIVLSAQQTIDGVAVLASNAAGVPDRVLCVGQTVPSQNGIYDVSTGSWTRSPDSNNNTSFKNGTTVEVARGSAWAGTYWRVSANDPITVDSTLITWVQAFTSGSVVTNSVTTTASALARTVYGRDTTLLSEGKKNIPSLVLADLASTAGLAVHASGGIIAAVAGVTGTGKIALPKAIDPTVPFRVHMLIEMNGDTVNNLVLQLGSTGVPPFWSGLKTNVLKQSGFNASAGSSTLFNALGDTGSGGPAIPNGTQFWISICGDGQRVTSSIIPNIAQGAFAATWWQRCSTVFRPQYNVVNWADEAIGDVSSGAGQYTWGRAGQADQLTQIYFTSTSVTTRLIGVYCNIGEMDSPGDARLGAPVAMMWSNSQDNDGIGATCPFVLLPPYWGSPGARDFVMQHHPNGTAGTFLMSNSGPTALSLYAGGYGQGVITGCKAAADYPGATSSNWGAPTGLQYRKNFTDYFRNAFRFDGKLIHLGLSMGLMNALRYIAEYGEGDAVVGVSGVCNLTDSFNSRGFAGVINAGYGAWYESLVDANTGNTPELSPTQWKRMNRGTRGTGLKSLLSPFNWRDVYVGATTYAKADVVYRAYAGGIAGLATYDPVLTPRLYIGVPIQLYHGTADATIPVAQATAFVAAVNAQAGTAAVSQIAGGGHLDATMWATLPAVITAYLDALT